MLSLFSTGSDTSGFRLKYMEIYNWGTFHERIFRMEPQGNNALLTGANASGKSTIIDALLTLMVPAKKDRFYNQSSGVEKKGNRTEETYVLGNYGNIQRDGESGASTQSLRDHSAYSVLLATFTNTDTRVVTVFQVRWFSGGELRRTFGLAHCELDIKTDFQPFDGKGMWRRRLESSHKGNRTMVEFFEGPVGYADRITQLFGMRSVKALSLFNQIVGVKVLDDLDDFIRTNMLEEQHAESQYIMLKDSFKTLMEAKTNIEKAGKQIELLTPISEYADEIKEYAQKIKQLSMDRESIDYWFARKTIELGKERVDSLEQEQERLEKEEKKLRDDEDRMRQDERSIALAIENDEVGRKIKEMEQEIKRLEELRDERVSRMDEYNSVASVLSLTTDPDKDTFISQRDSVAGRLEGMNAGIEQKIRETITFENERKDIGQRIDEYIKTIDSLKKNKNNISGRESEIREMILEHTGATKDEIPFIGELIRVNPAEMEWEGAIEKILHNFALHLLVPDQYYHEVNKFLNSNDLKGRITYYRYRTYNSLAGMDTFTSDDARLLDKIEIRPDSEYEEWIRDTIFQKYNYACVENLEEFERYQEKAVTREGLIKFSHDRHEKDDRPQVVSKANYILGWDNQDKISLLQHEIKELQEKDIELMAKLNDINSEKQKLQYDYDMSKKLVDMFKDFDAINWKEYATRLQEKLSDKAELEKNNNTIQALQKQLEQVRQAIRKISLEEIRDKVSQISDIKSKIKETKYEMEECQKAISSMRSILLSDFEQAYEELKNCTYEDLDKEYKSFISRNDRERNKLFNKKREAEDKAKNHIRDFKYPSEYITEKFKDWRSDVNALPDADNIDLIDEYQEMLRRLQRENLPKYEKQFDNYLQKTLTDKVGDFRMFFINWKSAIDDNIRMLNESLHGIDYRKQPATYIQLVMQTRINEEVREFRRLMDEAMPNVQKINSTIDGRKIHFRDHIQPFMERLENEDWRNRVMDVRSWFTYKAEEFNRNTGNKETTYENMGHLSGGEKAQLTYTILGSAIAYQFGLTKSGMQDNSFRFIAIDEAFKAQDEDKARYLIDLCKQLHLQLLVVTPNDNIHIVENDISYVYFVERKEEKTSWLYSMPIEQWRAEKNPGTLF
ncbi:ATP-binding protein [Bacteroides sp. ET336]|uniref:ATP-binding protein n=1 Tax=Bacteroides sp. ET336 TaxID=2972459 RepID=UPI0021ACB206|nr:SbcC/MukB-like Walker B domain-containing protein [Bacteroides sp. ET336]MCR8892807.1 AAA family ATPase [Bacteroides sp. ET336]MDN0057304.1 SbcC/MukB-like Walker B domain-containing protein [Bacteroides caecigallinarum]